MKIALANADQRQRIYDDMGECALAIDVMQIAVSQLRIIELRLIG